MNESHRMLGLFWGKAGHGLDVHPAICHMIDVGQVASVFFERVAADSTKKFLCEPFENPVDKALSILEYFVACHDIGKISPGFQAKRKDLIPPLLDLKFKFRRRDQTDHSRTTEEVVAEHFHQEHHLSRQAARQIGRALGAHHGFFHPSSPYGASGLGRGLWVSSREETMRHLKELFGADDIQLPREMPPKWTMILSGLVSVCDWIGSAQEFFPPAGVNGFEQSDYPVQSRKKAEAALDALGWAGWRPKDEAFGFNALFPEIDLPYEMQTAAVNLAKRLDGPGILIIEAPMGLGKTEASIAAAEQFVHREQLSGIYVALPTQATSNQMFGRLRKVLEHRYRDLKVDLHLIHGLSDLNEAYRELRLAAIAQEEDQTVRASSWFTARRRGLLAPFGVGTIDQALLAILTVKHMFVRLFGLGQKVVIFDEVHAYDTYTSRLLDRLLNWLSATGAPVIILTATLPSRRRAELVKAYTGVEPANSGAYPQIIAARRNEKPLIKTPAGGEPKRITLDVINPSDDPVFDVSDIFEKRLKNGGCAAWIRNTVAGAQQAFLTLRDRLAPYGIPVHLLHARYPVYRRLELERELLEMFGKGEANRPTKSVLVATQVIEQSLDLDFDLMVTDLAPVDLMLQRAGRLHRHLRNRPSDLKEPQLYWVSPKSQSHIPQLGVDGKIYDPYVLLRTWWALQTKQSVVLPEEIPFLIEQVYGEESLEDLPQPASEQLRRFRLEYQKNLLEMGHQADKVVLLPPEHPDGPMPLGAELRHEDPADVHLSLQVQTRLTRPSWTIICARRIGKRIELVSGQTCSLDREPTAEEVREIRRCSVSIQNPVWVNYFKQEESPSAWKRSAALRDCRLALFENSRLAVRGIDTVLELSDDRGLVVSPD